MSTDSPQVAAIKERYKASFPEKVEVIRTALNSVFDNDDLEPVKEELHKLAGSLGMYGYQELAAHCRSAMEHIDQRNRGELINDLNAVIELLTSDA